MDDVIVRLETVDVNAAPACKHSPVLGRTRRDHVEEISGRNADLQKAYYGTCGVVRDQSDTEPIIGKHIWPDC